MGMRLHSLMAGVAAYDLPQEVRTLMGEMVSSLGERVYLGAELAPARNTRSTSSPPPPTTGRRPRTSLTFHVGASITGTEITERGLALVGAANAVTTDLGGRVP